MDIKGYYKTLGVPENATAEEIKKKYRALCLKWHPDRWVNGTDEEKKNAEEQFKKVAEAYAVLGDEDKRREYDSGIDDSQAGFGDGGFDPFEEVLLRAGFGFGGGFNPFGGGQQRRSGTPGEDINAYVTITFAESLTEQLMREVTVKKRVACPDCHGTGSEDGQQHECPYCHGTGMESRTERKGNGYVMYQSPCSHCHGTGKQIDHPCKKCGGSGFVDKEEKMKLSIPGGLRDGMAVMYSGMGGEGSPGFPKGNLILHVTVTQDSPGYFQTYDKDLNIYHIEKVNFVDALLGGKVKVKCPNGSEWTINMRECTQPRERFTKSNGGYAGSNGYGTTRGDYIVIIEYDVPGKLTKEQRKALQQYKETK